MHVGWGAGWGLGVKSLFIWKLFPISRQDGCKPLIKPHAWKEPSSVAACLDSDGRQSERFPRRRGHRLLPSLLLASSARAGTLSSSFGCQPLLPFAPDLSSFAAAVSAWKSVVSVPCFRVALSPKARPDQMMGRCVYRR